MIKQNCFFKVWKTQPISYFSWESFVCFVFVFSKFGCTQTENSKTYLSRKEFKAQSILERHWSNQFFWEQNEFSKTRELKLRIILRLKQVFVNTTLFLSFHEQHTENLSKNWILNLNINAYFKGFTVKFLHSKIRVGAKLHSKIQSSSQ